MSSISIQLQGLKEVKDAIKSFPDKAKKQLATEFAAFGTDVVRDAKALAPVDEGHLKNSISYTIEANKENITVEIHVAADYAAYLEFGTRAFAERYVSSLPSDWQTFASTFRGPGGGSFAELVDRLTRSVRLKGISGRYEYVSKKPKRVVATGKGVASKKAITEAEDYNTAYLIALSIIKKGIRAHPFLYPAVVHNKQLLIEQLNKMTFK